MKKLTLLAIVLFSACATTGTAPLRQDAVGRELTFRTFPIDWGFDCDFPENLKKIVREGFAYWDDLTPVDLFHETDVCGRMIGSDQSIIVNATDRAVERDGYTVFGTLSAVHSEGVATGGIINLYHDFLKWCDNGTRSTVVRHEVGHALGFDHNPGRDCLMYKFARSEDDASPVFRYPKQLCQEELRTFRQHYVPQTWSQENR